MSTASVGRRRAAATVAVVLILLGIVAPAVTASGRAGGEVPVLTEVRIARHDGFDRVVFEYSGVVVPAATIDGPRANGPDAVTGDPSGLPVVVGGARVFTVAMTPAIATYAASSPPGPLYSGPTSFAPTGTANVVAVVQTGDFESVLTWAIGFGTAATPQVSVLTAPTRVVVDVPHAAAPAQPAPGAPSFTG
jgi:hypothetical protein